METVPAAARGRAAAKRRHLRRVPFLCWGAARQVAPVPDELFGLKPRASTADADKNAQPLASHAARALPGHRKLPRSHMPRTLPKLLFSLLAVAAVALGALAPAADAKVRVGIGQQTP